MADGGPLRPGDAWWPGAYRPHTLGADCWCRRFSVLDTCYLACWVVDPLNARDVFREITG